MHLTAIGDHVAVDDLRELPLEAPQGLVGESGPSTVGAFYPTRVRRVDGHVTKSRPPDPHGFDGDTTGSGARRDGPTRMKVVFGFAFTAGVSQLPTTI